MSLENTKEKIQQWVNRYALNNGYSLNKNKESLDLIITGLASRKEKYGHQYCPCRVITGNNSIDKDFICPCKNHKIDIEKNGSCHCNLFYK